MRVKLPRVVSSLLLLILGLFTVGGILVLVLNMWVGEVGNDTFAGGGILVLVLDMLVGEVESDTDANKCNKETIKSSNIFTLFLCFSH